MFPWVVRLFKQLVGLVAQHLTPVEAVVLVVMAGSVLKPTPSQVPPTQLQTLALLRAAAAAVLPGQHRAKTPCSAV